MTFDCLPQPRVPPRLRSICTHGYRAEPLGPVGGKSLHLFGWLYTRSRYPSRHAEEPPPTVALTVPTATTLPDGALDEGITRGRRYLLDTAAQLAALWAVYAEAWASEQQPTHQKTLQRPEFSLFCYRLDLSGRRFASDPVAGELPGGAPAA